MFGPLSLGLKLLGIGRWLKEASSALFGLVRRYPLQAALIASLCLSGWLWRGRQAERVEAARWETAFSDQKLAYEKAQAEAKAKQIAADTRELELKSLLSEKADDLSRLSSERTRIAVADYARTHRLRCEAADGAASGTASPGVPGDPGRAPESPEAADMVAVTRSDLDALADEAVQGAVRQRYLNALIDAGWAVPASRLPRPALSAGGQP